jgi:putative nucleotidyltransferase with HDIG domain
MTDMTTENLERLLEIIRNIAAGKYSEDILQLTGDDTPEPIRTVAEAVGLMMVKIEAREYHLSLLVEELKQLNEKIRLNSLKTVSAMAQALEARDPYTRGHTERVAQLAVSIAKKLGLEEDCIEDIRIGGILHDIGKIGFSDRLFQPHESKNPPEIIKEITKHPAIGAEILKDLDFLGKALDYIHTHHERPDGKGYPRQLHGEQLLLGARILAVADGYDAMTTDRPYQKGMSREEALQILRKNSGTKWDPACIQALEGILDVVAKSDPDIPVCG